MRVFSLRRGALIVATVVGAGGLLISAGPVTRQPAFAVSSAPVVVRDKEAGGDVLSAMHKVTDCSPSACEQPDTATEPSIAANPLNPLNAVAVYQIGRVDDGGDVDNGFATTFDGGKTWTSGYLPGLTRAVGGPFSRASDAVVAFGPDGTVYANSLVFDDTTSVDGIPCVPTPGFPPTCPRSGMAMNMSHDGGRTWSAPVFLQDDRGAGLNDKNWIVVDQTNEPGHHKGRVYCVWDRIAPVIVNYSDDQGKTWLPVFSVVYAGQGIGSVPLVMKDGSLAILFSTYAGPLPTVRPGGNEDTGDLTGVATSLVLAISPKAGMVPTGAPLVFAPPVDVSSYQGHPVREQRAATIPSADIDLKTGRMYVSWEDGRFRSDALVNDIVITSSLDGIQWTKPVRVNRGPQNDYVDRWNAAVAVGPDSSVRIAYRERQEAASMKEASPNIDTFFQQSTDEGKTWSAPLQVNSIRTDVGFAAISRAGAFLGDYQQTAAAGPLTYVVRNEAYAPRPGLTQSFDPAKYFRAHQTTWVGVIGTESNAAPGASSPAVAAAQQQVLAARSGRLPATGGHADARPALLVALATLTLWMARGRRRRHRAAVVRVDN